MADNLHRQFDHIEDFETERPQTMNYQDYQGLNSNSIKLQDMIFFGRISSFCVSTVLVAFLFLVAQVATFWAFFWAITISVIGQIGIYVLIEYYRTKTLTAGQRFLYSKRKHHVLSLLFCFCCFFRDIFNINDDIINDSFCFCFNIRLFRSYLSCFLLDKFKAFFAKSAT